MSTVAFPDFGSLMPEINSGLMYFGAGPGPMLTASVAWDVLATDLYATATAYGSVISDLSSSWRGPSATSMVAAATPYVAWLHTTATQVEQTGAQARAAAAAYESAFAATVPPPVIAANRALLMMLIATNFFGQNAPAIAATEAHYAAMWAQDAAAMYGYAAASTALDLALNPFGEAPLTTNAAGLVGQQAQTAGSAAATQTQMVSAATGSGLAAPTTGSSGATSSTASTSASTSSALSALSSLSMAMYPAMIAARLAIMPMTALMGRAMAMGAGVPAAAGVSGVTAGGLGRGLTLVGVANLGGGGTPVSAGVGRATAIGKLAVPPRWITASQVRLVSAMPSRLPGVTVAAPASAGAPGVPFGIPVAHNGRNTDRSNPVRFEMRPNMVPRFSVGG